MIIWGWRTRASVAATGEFHCPHCATKKPYKHEKLRSWFTLYFIPLIPLQEQGEHVTCVTCNKHWDIAALGRDPEKLQNQQFDDIARDWLASMSMISAVAGTPSREVAQTVVADLESAIGRRHSPDDVFAVLRTAPAGAITPEIVVARLGALPANLSTAGKELFLSSVLKVLRMVTNCGPSEVALVRAVGAALGISDSHTRGILLDAGMLQ